MAQSLLDAVQGSDLAAVRAALELCNGLDAAPSPLPPMTPPLIEAVCAGRRDCMELLLQRGASLDTHDVAYGALASFVTAACAAGRASACPAALLHVMSTVMSSLVGGQTWPRP